jgi:hypothetical protein
MVPAFPRSTGRSAHGWWLPVLAILLVVGAFLPSAAPASVAVEAVPPPLGDPDPSRVPPLWMPVAGAVVRGFDARAGPFGPGHRGIDVATPVGAIVRAPAPGTVVFAGPVAGTTWISLQVAPGVLVTLGPLLDPAPAGPVRPSAPVGRVGPGHPGGSAGPGGSAPRPVTLHLGVRVDGVYVDPLAFLVDRPRARLAPLPTPGGLPAGR